MSATITPWPDGDRPEDWATNSFLIDEVMLSKEGGDDPSIVADLYVNLNRARDEVLARIDSDAVVHPGLVSVSIDYNHLQWRSGVVVERIVDTSGSTWQHYIRVASAIYVEGMRVEGYIGSVQKLVKV